MVEGRQNEQRMSPLSEEQLGSFLACATTEYKLLAIGALEFGRPYPLREWHNQYMAMQHDQPADLMTPTRLFRLYENSFDPQGMMLMRRQRQNQFFLTAKGNYHKALAGHLLSLVEQPEVPSLNEIIGCARIAKNVSVLSRLHLLESMATLQEPEPVEEISGQTNIPLSVVKHHAEAIEAAGLIALRPVPKRSKRASGRNAGMTDLVVVEPDQQELMQRFIAIVGAFRVKDRQFAREGHRHLHEITDDPDRVTGILQKAVDSRTVRAIPSVERLQLVRTALEQSQSAMTMEEVAGAMQPYGMSKAVAAKTLGALRRAGVVVLDHNGAQTPRWSFTGDSVAPHAAEVSN